MNINNIIKNKEKKTISISIRTTPTTMKWLQKHEYSATAIFNEAIKEIQQDEKMRTWWQIKNTKKANI